MLSGFSGCWILTQNHNTKAREIRFENIIDVHSSKSRPPFKTAVSKTNTEASSGANRHFLVMPAAVSAQCLCFQAWFLLWCSPTEVVEGQIYAMQYTTFRDALLIWDVTSIFVGYCEKKGWNSEAQPWKTAALMLLQVFWWSFLFDHFIHNQTQQVPRWQVWRQRTDE